MTALPSITVRLDDRAVAMPAGTTLAELLDREHREPTSVATAINGLFIARGAREQTTLRDGDVVLFFQPIVGG